MLPLVNCCEQSETYHYVVCHRSPLDHLRSTVSITLSKTMPCEALLRRLHYLSFAAAQNESSECTMPLLSRTVKVLLSLPCRCAQCAHMESFHDYWSGSEVKSGDHNGHLNVRSARNVNGILKIQI
jgi:hypothetical protein